MPQAKKRTQYSNNTGCLGIIFSIFFPVPPAKTEFLVMEKPSVKTEPPPYAIRDHFLSPAELNLYKILINSIPEGSTLISKVRLSDIFYVQQPHINRGAMNRIHMKHVDFLICNSQSMHPILGVELDDKSHNRRDRQARDEFVDSVFAIAGLPMLHIQAASEYNEMDLRCFISSALASGC